MRACVFDKLGCMGLVFHIAVSAQVLPQNHSFIHKLFSFP